MSIRHNRRVSSSQVANTLFNKNLNHYNFNSQSSIPRYPDLQLPHPSLSHKDKENVADHNSGHSNLQYQILLEKMKKTEAKLSEYKKINEELQQQNGNIISINNRQSHLIEQLNQTNKDKQRQLKDTIGQLEARKKSTELTIKELRQNLQEINIKNQKLVEVIKYLESTIEKLEDKYAKQSSENAKLKSQMEHIDQQYENTRKKMAKAELESQKYKIKALEAEQYWMSKFQKQKRKQKQETDQFKQHYQSSVGSEVNNLRAELEKLTKINSIKQNQIKSLEDRIDQLIRDKSM